MDFIMGNHENKLVTCEQYHILSIVSHFIENLTYHYVAAFILPLKIETIVVAFLFMIFSLYVYYYYN